MITNILDQNLDLQVLLLLHNLPINLVTEQLEILA